MILINRLVIFLITLTSFTQGKWFEKQSNMEKVSAVKDHVLRHYSKSIAPDVMAIKSSNWYFERFLQEYNYDEKKAEKSIIEGFDHFHKEGFHQINDSYFPSETYAVGGMYRFGKSKLDQPLVGVVMNHIRPLGIRLSNGAVMKLIEKFSLYNIYKTVFEAKEKNFIAYIVFSNTSMENTEFSLFQKTMLALNKYFPGVPAKIYIVGMNKMMEVSVKILVNLLKPSLKQRMAFVERVEQMDDLVSIEEVPVHAGGRNQNFQRIPAGARSGKCLQYMTGITPKEWDIYREINVGAIQEGMRESKSNSMDLYLKSCDN